MPAITRIVAGVAGVAGVAAAAAAGGLAAAAGLCGAGSGTAAAASTTTAPIAPQRLVAHRMRPRPGAIPRGTRVISQHLFTPRVFPTARTGFALADGESAQYPALSTDGGATWRIDGPQLHVDAADGPEGVGFVGTAGPRAFFAYGSSVIDATTDGGRSWWETFAGELVMSVVPGPHRGELIAFVQQSVSNQRLDPAVTWQYVSRDGGRTWSYSTALGGVL